VVDANLAGSLMYIGVSLAYEWLTRLGRMMTWNNSAGCNRHSSGPTTEPVAFWTGAIWGLTADRWRRPADSVEERPDPRQRVTVYTVFHKKGRHHTHGDISVKSQPIFQIFFTGWFSSKFAVEWLLKIPPHLAYVAILPCETLIVRKQAINDKLQL